MIGVIEFLRKADEVCRSQGRKGGCRSCPILSECIKEPMDYAEFVRKVIDYQIEEVEDAERN